MIGPNLRVGTLQPSKEEGEIAVAWWRLPRASSVQWGEGRILQSAGHSDDWQVPQPNPPHAPLSIAYPVPWMPLDHLSPTPGCELYG